MSNFWNWLNGDLQLEHKPEYLDYSRRAVIKLLNRNLSDYQTHRPDHPHFVKIEN